MNVLIEKNLEQIKSYCKKYDVEKLHAFGSVTNEEFSDNSDVDLLIKFKDISYERYADNYFRLHELFEKIFNRKVDLVTEKSLSNPYFIKKVTQNETFIYED